MLLLVTALRLLDVAAVVFTAAGCVSAFVAVGDDAVGSITIAVVVGLDVGHDAAMLLTMLMLVTNKVGCSHRRCWYEC